MIRRLTVNRHAPQHAMAIVGRHQNRLEKQIRVHVMRAAERRQRPARPQQFQRAQMNLLVAPHRVRHGIAVSRERRRIENDAVKPRHDLFVRGRHRLRLQPVEHVHALERASVAEAICVRVLRRGDHGVRALVQAQHAFRPGACGVQREAAEKAEAIQHVPRAGHFHEVGDALIIFLLIQIQPRLVPCREIELEFQPVQFHAHRPRRVAQHRPLRLGQTLEATRRHVVPLQNRARRKNFLQRRNDHRLALIHRERRRLEHQHVLVLVHDQTAEQIPLRIHDAK